MSHEQSNIFVGSGTDSEVNGGHEERRESQGGSQDGSAERGVGPRSTVLVNGEHETDGLGLEDYEADQSALEENEDKERELFPRDRREFDAAWRSVHVCACVATRQRDDACLNHFSGDTHLSLVLELLAQHWFWFDDDGFCVIVFLLLHPSERSPVFFFFLTVDRLVADSVGAPPEIERSDKKSEAKKRRREEKKSRGKSA